jgi:hypothetical protein
VSDLLVDHPKLSYDITVASHGVGAQKVLVNVFDVCYSEVSPDLRGDFVQMRTLPPPLTVLPGSTSGAGGSIESERDATAPDLGAPDTGVGGSAFPWQQYGAYVVRVQLYNITPSGSLHLVRTAEEAFSQVLEP